MKHTWLLPIVLTAGLSSVYFLPQVGAVANSAVNMDLPVASGSWIFRTFPATEAEIKTLGKDTKFSKAACLSARPGEYDVEGLSISDQIQLSIVLSGYDLNNSIHRPERCMPAQGHNITSSSDVTLKLSNDRQFQAKRLLSVQRIQNGEKETDVLEFNCITYYFFVGHDHVTNDHLKRTFIDMKDRLVRGLDQRWAYTSVSMWYGDVPMVRRGIPMEEADQKLRDFIAGFAKKQINWDQIIR